MNCAAAAAAASRHRDAGRRYHYCSNLLHLPDSTHCDLSLSSHLVICGGLTFETLKNLVKNFVHHDWTETSVGMVVINRSPHQSSCLVVITHNAGPQIQAGYF